MHKRPLTFGYIFFYILFLPDTWQILIGIVAAGLLTPYVVSPDMGDAGRAILFIMIATIGYAASVVPARRIAGFIRKRVLS